LYRYWHSRVIIKDAALVSTGVRRLLYKRRDPVDFSLVGVRGKEVVELEKPVGLVNYYIRLTAFFKDNLGKPVPES